MALSNLVFQLGQLGCMFTVRLHPGRLAGDALAGFLEAAAWSSVVGSVILWRADLTLVGASKNARPAPAIIAFERRRLGLMTLTAALSLGLGAAVIDVTAVPGAVAIALLGGAMAAAIYFTQLGFALGCESSVVASRLIGAGVLIGGFVLGIAMGGGALTLIGASLAARVAQFIVIGLAVHSAWLSPDGRICEFQPAREIAGWNRVGVAIADLFSGLSLQLPLLSAARLLDDPTDFMLAWRSLQSLAGNIGAAALNGWLVGAGWVKGSAAAARRYRRQLVPVIGVACSLGATGMLFSPFEAGDLPALLLILLPGVLVQIGFGPFGARITFAGCSWILILWELMRICMFLAWWSMGPEIGPLSFALVVSASWAVVYAVLEIAGRWADAKRLV